MPARKTASPHDDILLLVATLPVELQAALHKLPLDELLEVVMDLGRVP